MDFSSDDQYGTNIFSTVKMCIQSNHFMVTIMEIVYYYDM